MSYGVSAPNAFTTPTDQRIRMRLRRGYDDERAVAKKDLIFGTFSDETFGLGECDILYMHTATTDMNMNSVDGRVHGRSVGARRAGGQGCKPRESFGFQDR